MKNISKYDIKEVIYESSVSIIYRAFQKDGKPVIIKGLKKEYPSQDELASLKNEYEILKSLNIAGVSKVYSFDSHKNFHFIVMEDCGAQSILALLNHSIMPIKDFLPLAIKVVTILGEIHKNGIVHKDINPNNIIFNPQTNQAFIIDFGISTYLSVESSEMQTIAGTLPYISPEQTGRMNRSVDYRTDFYSLGMTFYEMLFGYPPFRTVDPIEMVHCHIAKEPTRLYKLSNDIPKPISDIIMKLISKMAEDRYQSILGLKSDLEICWQQFKSTGTIEDFQIGQKDLLEKFQIPEKLYGREKDIDQLLSAFNNISSGTTELILVSGFSGTGKSSLINELVKPIFQKRGYFICGKFDQFKRNIPLFSIKEAFQELTRQILAEPEKNIVLWKEKLLKALGMNGQLIIDIIPEVEFIIGKQEPIQELGPIEMQNRLNRVFQNFVQVFAHENHPLVIFLDDLQWADSASLSFIEIILNQKYTMIIGAYRDNEVNAAHPLTITIEKIQQSGKMIHNISLSPLDLSNITQLLIETLNHEPEKVYDLAELALKKTNGNPFFLKQFLNTLYQKKLIFFNKDTESWEWQIEKIEYAGITENVVELMIEKIQRLSETTQDILKLSSCIGNRFDLDILSAVNGKSVWENQNELLNALKENFILSIPDPNQKKVYKFSHDRIHLASYLMLNDITKKETHLKIGHIMLNMPQHDDNIFQIVNHMNLSKDLLINPDEKKRLIYLNLQAGKKAKASASYEAALQYLITSMDLLDENSWESDYELTFFIYKEQAELGLLNSKYIKSEQLLNIALEKARTPLEKAEIYMILNTLNTIVAKYVDAIEYAKKGLELLGVDLPKEDINAKGVLEMDEVKKSLQGRSVASLIDLPEMTDPAKILALKISVNVAASIYFAGSNLYGFIMGRAVNLSLKYGQSKQYTIYSYYGLAVLGIQGDFKLAYEYGALSLKLCEKFDIKAQKCLASAMAASFLYSWVRPVQQQYSISVDGYQLGLESGEFILAGQSINGLLRNEMYKGENLEKLLTESSNYLLFAQKMKFKILIDAFSGYKIIFWNLTGRTNNEDSFHNEEQNETQYLETAIANKSLNPLCYYYISRAQTDYIYGNYSKAYNWIKETEKIIVNIMGQIFNANYHFFEAMILIRLYEDECSDENKSEWMKKIEFDKNKIKVWADSCPDNFLHKYLLIEAELARISKDDLKAIELYDQAIASATGFIHMEAIGNELAAQLWLRRGKQEFADVYLNKALACYKVWGAQRRVKMLEKKYPNSFVVSSDNAVSLKDTSTKSIMSFAFDVMTLVKASQAISNEISLDLLLKKIMQIVIENAGAERGVFILNNEGKLNVEAEISSEQKYAKVLQSIPIEQHGYIPDKIVSYVARTKETLVLNDACNKGLFKNDVYVTTKKTKSILCLPLINQTKLIGILYLENNLATDSFIHEGIKLLEMLSAQIAISIENATIYNRLEELNKNLEEKVIKRTEQLQTANNKLHQEILERQKLERQKEDIERMVHHDLKTPINGILGICNNIPYEKALNLSELKKMMNIVKDNGEHMLNMIENALDIFKIEQGTYQLYPAPCDMVKMFYKISGNLQVLKRAKHIEIVFEIDQKPMEIENSYWIQGEQSLLINLFGNLFKNAIEASPTDKNITVSIQTLEHYHKINVHNFGTIPEKIQSRFFEKYSTSGKKGGTGLGTYSAFLITSAHGGKISFTTSEQDGTDIIVLLPKIQKGLSYTKEVISQQVSEDEIVAISKEELHILVAEDNPNNHMIIQMMLGDYPYTIDMVENGKEAIEKVTSEQAEKYDIILMDMEMPLIDGLDATKAIRKYEETHHKANPIPIVALTADTSDKMRKQCKEYGCTAFLSKPIESQTEILKTIACCLKP